MFFTPEVKDERDEGNYCQGDVEYRSQVDHRVTRLRNECLRSEFAVRLGNYANALRRSSGGRLPKWINVKSDEDQPRS